MESSDGKHRANQLLMVSETPDGLPPEKHIKDYDGGPILGEEKVVTSILEVFDLFYPTTIIRIITRNTN